MGGARGRRRRLDLRIVSDLAGEAIAGARVQITNGSDETAVRGGNGGYRSGPCCPAPTPSRFRAMTASTSPEPSRSNPARTSTAKTSPRARRSPVPDAGRHGGPPEIQPPVGAAGSLPRADHRRFLAGLRHGADATLERRVDRSAVDGATLRPDSSLTGRAGPSGTTLGTSVTCVLPPRAGSWVRTLPGRRSGVPAPRPGRSRPGSDRDRTGCSRRTRQGG